MFESGKSPSYLARDARNPRNISLTNKPRQHETRLEGQPDRLASPVLTYGRDHSDGEVKGARELPLDSGFVRLELQNHELELLEVRFGQVKFAHEFVLPGVQPPLVTFLLLGLQGLEDGRPDHQVGEDADDEGERPGVLSLHGSEMKGGQSAARGS